MCELVFTPSNGTFMSDWLAHQALVMSLNRLSSWSLAQSWIERKPSKILMRDSVAMGLVRTMVVACLGRPRMDSFK